MAGARSIGVVQKEIVGLFAELVDLDPGELSSGEVADYAVESQRIRSLADAHCARSAGVMDRSKVWRSLVEAEADGGAADDPAEREERDAVGDPRVGQVASLLDRRGGVDQLEGERQPEPRPHGVPLPERLEHADTNQRVSHPERLQRDPATTLVDGGSEPGPCGGGSKEQAQPDRGAGRRVRDGHPAEVGLEAGPQRHVPSMA